MKFTGVNGNELPGYAQVTQDGQAVVANTYKSIGPGGSLNSVYVDGLGNAFYAGTTYGAEATYDGYSYLMVNKIAPDQTQIYSHVYALRQQLRKHVHNWVGNDIKLDPAGNVVMATTYDDGKNLANSYSQWIFKVDSSGVIRLDQGNGGFVGTKNEAANGIGMDWNGNLWAVGNTSSPDLPVNGFQTVYAGDPGDGWIRDSLLCNNAEGPRSRKRRFTTKAQRSQRKTQRVFNDSMT